MNKDFVNSIHRLSWMDDIDSCRCEVPRDPSRPTLIPGCLGVAFATLFGSWPFLLSAFFYFVTRDAARMHGQFDWIVLGMSKGFYPGYDREISEVYVFRIGEGQLRAPG
jgi:hypothetical protein